MATKGQSLSQGRAHSVVELALPELPIGSGWTRVRLTPHLCLTPVSALSSFLHSPSVLRVLPQLVTCTQMPISAVLLGAWPKTRTLPRRAFPLFLLNTFFGWPITLGTWYKFFPLSKNLTSKCVSDVVLVPGWWTARTSRLQSSWSGLGKRGLIRAWLSHSTWPMMSTKLGKLMISYLLVKSFSCKCPILNQLKHHHGNMINRAFPSGNMADSIYLTLNLGVAMWLSLANEMWVEVTCTLPG